jgi:hypothetical protein
MTDQPNQDRRRKKSPDPTPVWLAEGSYPRKILEEIQLRHVVTTTLGHE